MINDVFKSLHESIKKRNSPSDFLPTDKENLKDIIHRGYLKKSAYPIKYDIIPDGKTKNTGKHIYSFKSGGSSGFLEIDHKYSPQQSGHETRSKVHFELEGKPPEDDIQIYRSFIVPAMMHHMQSHSPDIVDFSDSVIHHDDIIRRIGAKFESDTKNNSRTIKKKIDPKILRVISHFKTLNKKQGE
jgi:hypothetical protein